MLTLINTDIQESVAVAVEVLAPLAKKRRRKDAELVKQEEAEARAINSPNIIRSDFLDYLKRSFPHRLNWTHPITKEVFDYSYIKDTIEEYKYISPGFYKPLWALWTSQATRAFISEHFNYSGSTIRRRWDKSIDTILLMLIFPELKADDFKLYAHVY